MIPTVRNADILRVWEEAGEQPPHLRSLHLLMGLCCDPESVYAMPVGERDRQLMFLRSRLFGDVVQGLCECAACREPVEIEFGIGDVLETAASAAVPSVPLEHDGYAVQWRLPTCGDVAELAATPTCDRIRDRLLDCCLIDIRRESGAVAVRDCPEEVIGAVCEAMSQADPLGDFRLELFCPACETAWTTPFDIGVFLWREIDNWARQILPEVHYLASAYGWPEREILSMSPRRRRAYLDLLGA